MKKSIIVMAVGFCVLLIARPAWPIPATLTDDIYIRPNWGSPLIYDNDILTVGYPLKSPLAAVTTYFRFELPEVDEAGDFTFHLGLYQTGAMNWLPTWMGLYVIPDTWPDSPQAMSTYYPLEDGLWPSDQTLVLQEVAYEAAGWIYFDWMISIDSDLHAGLLDGVLSLALAVPSNLAPNGYYNFSSSDYGGTFSPFLEYEDPLPGTPVPEPGTMLLLGAGLIGLAGLGRKKFVKK